MKNREIFLHDPVKSKLLNDGVAAVTEVSTSKEIETLRYELEHFVCEGQYRNGIVRIIESFLSNIDSASQPAVWVSGFYGSGKSHLLKMLRHLWVNTKFDADGATARGLAQLPTEVKDLLKELDTMGKRCGGLHAAAGMLPTGGGESVGLAVLGIIFRSVGLPVSLPQAQFVMWLRKNGLLDHVRKAVEDAGKIFKVELHDLYVSPILAKAILDADPDFAPTLKEVRATLRAQFPVVSNISVPDFMRTIREVLSINRQIPCTVILLDEIQLFIGDSADRSTDVQVVSEALCKELDSRVLLIGSGQTALSGGIPLLQRLKGRFTIPVELTDTDVETVTRRVVLDKKADKYKIVEDLITNSAGEIDRQLIGTKIAPRSEDRSIIVEDYPILPVRRRFWEHVFRAIDIQGASSQLRTQLRIVHDAVRDIAEKPLGTVVPADVAFDQLQPDLLRTGVLLREIDETIRKLDDGTADGELSKRVCGLIFLIRKLPREAVADIGVRATPDMIADLLISDLSNDGTVLRKDIPRILDKLVKDGKLIKIDEEYSLQTRESSEWDREYRNRVTKLNGDLSVLSGKRTDIMNAALAGIFNSTKLKQGKCNEPRRLKIQFGADPPESKGNEIPLWVRDGWGDSESTVISDARSAGSDCPTLFIYVKKTNAVSLKKAITEYEAAKATLDFKGTPTTPEGREARDAMATRMGTAETTRDAIIKDVINAAKVIQGGGQERFELTMKDKVLAAAEASLVRMFPEFHNADDARWPSVINRAKNGDENALQGIGWNEAPEKHPVCSSILSEIGSEKTGKEIRANFGMNPYGWPRDAIDGALITLFTTGHIRATHKGSPLTQGQLDQAKIAATSFRLETVTIDVRGRIKLRKLFQTAGLGCKPGEESKVAGKFLEKLMEKAGNAGGESPMPARPSVTHVEAIKGLAGNEQLDAILKQHDTLLKQLSDWSDLEKLATERNPNWITLMDLLKHAAVLSEFGELQKQADAVRDDRRLLDSPDPVPAIKKEAVNALRAAVRQAYTNFELIYKQEMQILVDNENWKKISPEQQQKILQDEGIASLPQLSVGDDLALLRSLKETPLPIWRTKTDALQKQFNNASMAAVKLLEPKIIKVRLSSGTLKTTDDLKAWLAKTEKDLLEKISNGPIVVS